MADPMIDDLSDNPLAATWREAAKWWRRAAIGFATAWLIALGSLWLLHLRG